VSSLTERLLASDFCVAAPCLAGHGGTLDQLASSTWQDWYETVRVAYHELRRTVERIYYVGISLGALLGLKLASDEGWGVRALALLGTPVILNRRDRYTIPLVRYTPLRFAVRAVPKDYERSVAEPEGRQFYKMTSLPKLPAAAIYELVSLQHIISKDLVKIVNPLLLIHAKRDRVAPPQNVDVVKKTVRSSIIETRLLEVSEHVITLDYEKRLVAREVASFFEKCDETSFSDGSGRFAVGQV
jgi:carboxylesterase